MDDALNSLPCGYLTFTEDGTIRRVNATLESLLGYEPGEMPGRPVTAFFTVGARVFFQTHLFPSLKLRGAVQEVYLSLQSRAGSEVPVLLNAVRRGELNECVFVAMWQRSRFEDVILQARKTAEEAHRKLEDAHRKLEAQQGLMMELHRRERRIAEMLQDALRPAISDQIRGLDVQAYYQPALDEAKVGGDFYDVFALKPDCYVMVVADVSGKGLTAAVQVATIRHMLRALMYRSDLTIADSVTSLNDMLVEHNLLTGFATLFVGICDVSKRTLTYVNAGQEPGLLLRRETGQVEELEPTGPILGGFHGAVFRERVTPFAVEDVLALFTDGLTEAGASRKNMLEVSGVATILQQAVSSAASPAANGEITARIMERVEAAVTPAGIRDDVCLLVACGKK